jgi:hypothetical protein
MTDTTRKHPRTLAQAFPKDHAWPIEHYRAPFYRRADRLILALALVAALLATLNWI